MPKVQTAAVETSPSSRRGRGPRLTPSLSEINVVPLVDVMLVLLIIFMVAAPMMQTQRATWQRRRTSSWAITPSCIRTSRR